LPVVGRGNPAFKPLRRRRAPYASAPRLALPSGDSSNRAPAGFAGVILHAGLPLLEFGGQLTRSCAAGGRRGQPRARRSAILLPLLLAFASGCAPTLRRQSPERATTPWRSGPGLQLACRRAIRCKGRRNGNPWMGPLNGASVAARVVACQGTELTARGLRRHGVAGLGPGNSMMGWLPLPSPYRPPSATQTGLVLLAGSPAGGPGQPAAPAWPGKKWGGGPPPLFFFPPGPPGPPRGCPIPPPFFFGKGQAGLNRAESRWLCAPRLQAQRCRTGTPLLRAARLRPPVDATEGSGARRLCSGAGCFAAVASGRLRALGQLGGVGLAMAARHRQLVGTRGFRPCRCQARGPSSRPVFASRQSRLPGRGGAGFCPTPQALAKELAPAACRPRRQGTPLAGSAGGCLGGAGGK